MFKHLLKAILEKMNRKMEECFSQQLFTAKCELVFALTRKTRNPRGFILEPSERTQIPLQNSTRDF